MSGEAYKTCGVGHIYRGDSEGRGSRQRSKVLKALKNIASLALIDEVMREDARKRREKEREAMVSC